MSDRNFIYLNFNSSAPSVASSSNYVNVKNKNITNQIKNSTKKFKELSGSENSYKLFKTYLQTLLVNDVEKPFIDEIKHIKKERGNEEYLASIFRVFESIKRERENTEKALIRLKRYLDYMQKREKSNFTSRLYLPGLESESTLEPLILPDILGFSKSPAKAEQYNELILKMAKSFLGIPSDNKLKDQMKSFQDYLNNTSNYSENIHLDTLLQKPDYKIIRKLKTLYTLIKMMKTGRFDLNQIINSKDKDNSIKISEDSYKPMDFKRGDSKKKKKFKGIPGKRRFPGGGPPDNINYSSMMAYILRMEEFKYKPNGNRNRDSFSFEDKVRDFDKDLKVTGLNILKYLFAKSISKNDKFDNKLISSQKILSDICAKYYKKITPSSAPSEYLSCIGAPSITIENVRNFCLLFKSFFQTYIPDNFGKQKITLLDFYNGNNFSEFLEGGAIDKGEEEAIRFTYITYIGYRKYYGTYTLDRIIPKESPLESLYDGFRIVNGIGVYLTVLLEILTKIEQMLIQFEVRIEQKVKANQTKNQNIAKLRQSNQILDLKLLEREQLLREIDDNILKLKTSLNSAKNANTITNINQKIIQLVTLRSKIIT